MIVKRTWKQPAFSHQYKLVFLYLGTFVNRGPENRDKTGVGAEGGFKSGMYSALHQNICNGWGMCQNYAN